MSPPLHVSIHRHNHNHNQRRTPPPPPQKERQQRALRRRERRSSLEGRKELRRRFRSRRSALPRRCCGKDSKCKTNPPLLRCHHCYCCCYCFCCWCCCCCCGRAKHCECRAQRSIALGWRRQRGAAAAAEEENGECTRGRRAKANGLQGRRLAADAKTRMRTARGRCAPRRRPLSPEAFNKERSRARYALCVLRRCSCLLCLIVCECLLPIVVARSFFCRGEACCSVERICRCKGSYILFRRLNLEEGRKQRLKRRHKMRGINTVCRERSSRADKRKKQKLKNCTQTIAFLTFSSAAPPQPPRRGPAQTKTGGPQ